MKKKTDYIQKVADITGRPYQDVAQEMTALKRAKGVTFREYYNKRLWEASKTQQHILARRIVRARDKRNDHYESVANVLGITPKEVKERIKELNAKGICKVSAFAYASYELFRYEGEDLDEVLRLFARRKELKESLTEKLKAVDAGTLSYADLDDELAELYGIYQRITPESRYEKLKNKLAHSRPDLLEDEEAMKAASIDMAVTNYLLGFGLSEYVSFHFVGKTLAEKREFITDEERMRILEQINDVNAFDLLDSKFQAYQLLGRYYGRKMMYVTSKEDFEQFKAFCARRKIIVVKPDGDSLGRGIKPVSLRTGKPLREVFDELCQEYQSFVVEGLIVAHRKLKALNPDSINTVRVITYFDGKKAIVHDSFMKIGRRGSFVDNGGAGGILVSVDPKTGVLASDGCDENGVIYEVHPDTGVRLKGYQLPNWKKALKLALKLADKVPGLCYIGWDFACTRSGKWIVVEGNGKTQFFGQQCTTGVGKRRDFIETVGYEGDE